MMRRMGWTAGFALALLAGQSEAQSTTVPAGTVLPVQLDETVSLDPKLAGKSYRAHIARQVTLSGATVIPAGTAAKVTTRMPTAGNAKQAQAVLAEITLNGRAIAVPSQAARIESSPSASGQKKAAGAMGVKPSGAPASTAAVPTYVAVSTSAKQLAAGAKLGFPLERALSLQ